MISIFPAGIVFDIHVFSPVVLVAFQFQHIFLQVVNASGEGHMDHRIGFRLFDGDVHRAIHTFRIFRFVVLGFKTGTPFINSS